MSAAPEGPEGLTTVANGTKRGVEWLQCVHDPDGTNSVMAESAITEIWIVRDSHADTVFCCPYHDGMGGLALVGSIGHAFPLDSLIFEFVSDRPPQATPTGHRELPTGEQPTPSVAELPVAVHVLFDKLEIELVEEEPA